VLEGELAQALLGAATGQLEPGAIRIGQEQALCVVLAAGGYPGAPRTGDLIQGLDEAESLPGVEIYHAGTRLDGDRVLTAGGRVLGVTALAPTLEEARTRAYEAAAKISFEGMQMRTDIASKAAGGAA
jgi:phosphoribosylamine---glycine ligase